MPRDGYLLYERTIEQPRADEAETIKTIVASIERTSRSSSGPASASNMPKAMDSSEAN